MIDGFLALLVPPRSWAIFIPCTNSSGPSAATLYCWAFSKIRDIAVDFAYCIIITWQRIGRKMWLKIILLRLQTCVQINEISVTQFNLIDEFIIEILLATNCCTYRKMITPSQILFNNRSAVKWESRRSSHDVYVREVIGRQVGLSKSPRITWL